MYIIEVTGDIVVKDCVHYAMQLSCLSHSTNVSDIEDNAKYNYLGRRYEGNLVFDEKRKVVPYASYFAHKGIQCVPPGDIAIFCSGGGPAYYYLRDHLDIIKQKSNKSIDETIRDTYYNALFIECFSALELFFSDFVLCNIFSSDECYEKAKSYFIEKTGKQECNLDVIETTIRNFFTTNVVYHRFDKVKELFDSLDLKYSKDDKLLKTFLHKRNNIVHRFSISNVDRMCVTNATYEDVQHLLNEVNRYVSNIVQKNSILPL